MRDKHRKALDELVAGADQATVEGDRYYNPEGFYTARQGKNGPYVLWTRFDTECRARKHKAATEYYLKGLEGLATCPYCGHEFKR